VEIKTESRPPKHFSSALQQLVNYFFTLQGEMAGAQAVSNFDTLLAPFIYYDKLNYKQVKQSLQEFVYGLNISLRSGFQSTFSNITFDINPSVVYKDSYVVIGGKDMDKRYGEFQKEMYMLNNAFCEVMMDGDKTNKIFTFPIPTYNITNDFDWENEELIKLWEMTSKYGIPYFANFVNSELNPSDVRSMCCRLRLDTRKLHKSGGGLFGANPLTGSIGVVSINLPRIAYKVENEKEFYEELDKILYIAKDSLEIKRKNIENFTEQGMYPYIKYMLSSIKQRTDKYWTNHFSTIGIIGMNEALLNLFGYNILDDRGKKFAEDVLDYIRHKMNIFQLETGNLYNLEATPAEGTAYRLAMKDKKEFNDIITAGTKEIPYYTNSTHIPVDKVLDIFTTIKHQENLQKKYTGGTVIHLFIKDKIVDWKQTRLLVKSITSTFTIPYFSITPTFSICKNHGYISGEHKKCKKCNEYTQIYSRIVGYYRPISTWNNGKQQEFVERKQYDTLK